MSIDGQGFTLDRKANFTILVHRKCLLTQFSTFLLHKALHAPPPTKCNDRSVSLRVDTSFNDHECKTKAKQFISKQLRSFSHRVTGFPPPISRVKRHRREYFLIAFCSIGRRRDNKNRSAFNDVRTRFNAVSVD